MDSPPAVSDEPLVEPRLGAGNRLGGVSTKILPEQETTPRTSHGDGDHERFSHYADKHKITESMVTGTPIRALCGKVWVPSRDPKKYPVCPDCKEIYAGLPKGGGDGDKPKQ
ncbi:MAG: hypothetical protein K0R62_5333 [Nonomuraea muscovyensis]|nr:hypothetical protein [Nonomuraea muscovyensis]